jgi:flagellin
MKELAITANSENADFAKIEAGMAEMQAQIQGIIGAAQFNGANLLVDDVDGNGASQLTVLSSLDRAGNGGGVTASTISVATLDFTNNLAIEDRTTIADISSAQTALAELETYLQTAIDGAAALGSAAQRLSDQSEFVDKMSDALKLGISKLTDTDMEEASARLQSLQVQQQLAVQSLQIANQSPNTILQLFR